MNELLQRKDIQKALLHLLEVRVDKENYGMMSRKELTWDETKLLFSDNFFTLDSNFNLFIDKVKVAHVKRRYSATKTNGMHKTLKPKWSDIVWLD